MFTLVNLVLAFYLLGYITGVVAVKETEKQSIGCPTGEDPR